MRESVSWDGVPDLGVMVGSDPFVEGQPAPSVPSSRIVATASDVVFTNVVEREVFLRLNDAATARMAAATKENVGKRMAIVVDGKTNSAPVIQTPIPSGSVGFACKSEADAARVAAALAPSTAR